MIGGSSLQSVIGLLSNLVLIRYLSPEDFGSFALVIANAYLLSSLFNLRINDLVIRASKEELKNNLTLYGKYTLFQSVAVALSGFLMLWWSGYWNGYALLLIVPMFLNPYLSLQTALFERKLQYTKIAGIETFTNLSGHLISVVGVLLGYGVVVLYLKALSYPIIKLFGLAKIKALTTIHLQIINFKELITAIKMAKGFWLDAIAEQSFERVVYILIGNLLSVESVGYFYQAKLLIVIPHRLLSVITSRMTYSYLSQKANKLTVFWLAIKLEIILLVPLSILIYFFAKPVILLLYGLRWEETSDILKYMASLVFFFSLFDTIKFYHMSEHKMFAFLLWGRLVMYIVFIVGFLLIKYLYLPDVAPWIGFVFALSYGLSCLSLIFVKRKVFFGNVNEISL